MKSFFLKVRKLVREHTSWSALRTIGSSKLLTSSSVFFFTVPVVTKLLSEVPKTIEFPLSSSVIVLHLQLPFSWFLLFIAAACVILGNFIYKLACPAIVKKYRSYSDFVNDGRSTPDLLRHLSEIVPVELKACQISSHSNETATLRVNALEHILKNLLDTPDDFSIKDDTLAGIHPDHVHQLSKTSAAVVDQRPRAFSTIREASGYYNNLWRYVTFSLFAIALFLLCWIIAENVYFVTTYVLEQTTNELGKPY